MIKLTLDTEFNNQQILEINALLEEYQKKMVLLKETLEALETNEIWKGKDFVSYKQTMLQKYYQSLEINWKIVKAYIIFLEKSTDSFQKMENDLQNRTILIEGDK